MAALLIGHSLACHNRYSARTDSHMPIVSVGIHSRQGEFEVLRKRFSLLRVVLSAPGRLGRGAGVNSRPRWVREPRLVESARVVPRRPGLRSHCCRDRHPAGLARPWRRAGCPVRPGARGSLRARTGCRADIPGCRTGGAAASATSAMLLSGRDRLTKRTPCPAGRRQIDHCLIRHVAGAELAPGRAPAAAQRRWPSGEEGIAP